MQRALTLTEISSLSKDINEWHSYLGSISEREFYGLFNDLRNFTQPVPSSFIISMSRKMLELAYFGDGLENESRQLFIQMSDILFESGTSRYDSEAKRKIQDARESEIDYCERFGYKSGAIYEALRPHKIFEM